MNGQKGFDLLQKAVQALLSTVEITPQPSELWSIQYQQQPSSGSESIPTDDHVLRFPTPSLDLVFDDSILDHVKQVWQKIEGDDSDEFLVFQDRETYDDDS